MSKVVLHVDHLRYWEYEVLTVAHVWPTSNAEFAHDRYPDAHGPRVLAASVSPPYPNQGV